MIIIAIVICGFAFAEKKEEEEAAAWIRSALDNV